jgi:hypothetical protein
VRKQGAIKGSTGLTGSPVRATSIPNESFIKIDFTFIQQVPVFIRKGHDFMVIF